MTEASLTRASTVAIVVHGVGDHSPGGILGKARDGFRVFAGDDVKTQEVTIPGLPELESGAGSVFGLEITTGEQTHFLLPLVWSRLRPRAANEADLTQAYPGAASRIFDRLFQPIFYLMPACANAIRCIPAAPGVIRRLLTGLIALAYASLVPGFLMGAFLFVSYLTTLRVTLDRASYKWWRVLLLLIICWLLDWLVGKILMVFDFVGDVVGYVGKAKHRRNARERLLRVIREMANAAPNAQIVVIGHSLGTVLVTHSILEMKESENLGQRLSIVTMGSPLRLMAWFFPGLIRSPEELLAEFEKRNLIFSWANMWRDADVIGRGLEITGRKKFAEASLGNGTHTDYWADPRCWRAVVDYLRATTVESLEALVAAWKPAELSPNEMQELYPLMAQRIFMTIPIWTTFLFCLWYLDSSWHAREWIATLSLMNKIAAYTLIGTVWVLMVFWYITTTHPVGWPGTPKREMLARYRLNLFIGTTCLRMAFAVTAAVGLAVILWRSFTVK